MRKEQVYNQRCINNSSEVSSPVNELRLGQWELTFSGSAHTFSKKDVSDGLTEIHDWQSAFPVENTWTQNTYHIPSLFVRLDATIHEGNLAIYEIEERPSGIGITSQINQEFREHLERMKSIWPEFDVIISEDPKRRGIDDQLWLKTSDRDNPSPLVLVRAEPTEEEFHFLEERSVSSLKRKGDKSYGERMGMWRNVTHTDQLDFDESFVLKPMQGSKTRDIFIYIPKGSSTHPDIPGGGKTPGTYTKNKVERVVEESRERGGMYRQDFYPPMRHIDTHAWMIYRVFYGYNLNTKEWECMGGTWNARPNLKIHGSSDSLYGPVIVER